MHFIIVCMCVSGSVSKISAAKGPRRRGKRIKHLRERRESALPDPFFCINNRTHTHIECVTHLEFMTKSLGRGIHIFYFPTAVHALTHSSPNLFYPVVGKPIMSNNYSNSPSVPQTLPCSSLLFSHLLEVPESSHHTAITYSPPPPEGDLA